MIIDSHAHLSFLKGDKISNVLLRAKEAQISSIIDICTDERSLEEGLALRKEHPWIYLAAATTPHDVDKQGNRDFSKIEEAAKKGALIAVGETGLDYHYMHSKKQTQIEFFRRYIQLAIECQLPIIIHCRDAFDDFFSIIEEFKNLRGVLHCFTGNMDEAKKLIDLGWYISFSGIVTFKKSQELRNIAKTIPIDQMLVETDSPYLAPQEKRGKENEPSFISYTAKCLSEIKEISFEDFCKVTSKNTKNLFHIP